jgi:hypothetical protein
MHCLQLPVQLFNLQLRAAEIGTRQAHLGCGRRMLSLMVILSMARSTQGKCAWTFI